MSKKLKESPKKEFPKITVSYAEILARKLFYPENEFGKQLVELMGRKAITKKDIEQLKLMGFEVEIVPKKFDLPEGW